MWTRRTHPNTDIGETRSFIWRRRFTECIQRSVCPGPCRIFVEHPPTRGTPPSPQGWPFCLLLCWPAPRLWGW